MNLFGLCLTQRKPNRMQIGLKASTNRNLRKIKFTSLQFTKKDNHRGLGSLRKLEVLKPSIIFIQLGGGVQEPLGLFLKEKHQMRRQSSVLVLHCFHV